MAARCSSDAPSASTATWHSNRSVELRTTNVGVRGVRLRCSCDQHGQTPTTIGGHTSKLKSCVAFRTTERLLWGRQRGRADAFLNGIAAYKSQLDSECAASKRSPPIFSRSVSSRVFDTIFLRKTVPLRTREHRSTLYITRRHIVIKDTQREPHIHCQYLIMAGNSQTVVSIYG